MIQKSSIEKKAEHTPSGYSWIIRCSFDELKNEWGYYRGKDCIAMFCKDLRNEAVKTIYYEKKKTVPLTDEETESNEKQKVCYICEKEFSTDRNDESKVRVHCHYTGKFRGAAHNISNLRYKILKEIPIVFHNGSIYDYHFIIKQLAIEFKDEFECLGENSEEYITFSVPIKKKHDNDKTIICRLEFIDSFRFMSTSLSSLVDNLSEI